MRAAYRYAVFHDVNHEMMPRDRRKPCAVYELYRELTGAQDGQEEEFAKVREGNVRVELSLTAEQSASIPKQHGLPGQLEIEIERVSPATLVLRAAGRLLAHQSPSPSSPPGSQP